MDFRKCPFTQQDPVSDYFKTYMDEFFWIFTWNVIFKSMPTNYVHILLAAYNPREHLFSSKMVPICVGVSWLVMFCALMQLAFNAEILCMLSRYAVEGFLKQSPWDTENYLNVSVLYSEAYDYLLNFLVIWIGAGLCYKQLYKKYIWKMFTVVFLITSLLDLFSLLYVTWTYFEEEIPQDIRRSLDEKKTEELLQAAEMLDTDMYADAIFGPPIVHFLTARSTGQVSPGRDSLIITVCNVLMYLYRGMIDYKVKTHVESIVKFPIYASVFNSYPIFFFYPLFFHKLFLGKFLSRIFYLLQFLQEFLIFIITYQIVIEVAISEWQWARRWWYPTLLLSTLGFTFNLALKIEQLESGYLIITGMTGLIEMIVICWFYPQERLFDDMHFYFGTATASARKWSIRLVPWYYIFKTSRLYSIFLAGLVEHEDNNEHIGGDIKNVIYFYIVPFVLIGFGAVYAFYRFFIKQKQSFGFLFKPRPDWGPEDINTRRLRKQFDSRDFVGSQAPRCLSRHILAKAATPTYSLDVCYDETDIKIRHTSGEDNIEIRKLYSVMESY